MKCMYEWTRRSVYGVDEGTKSNYQTTIVHHVADLIKSPISECQLLKASIKYSSQCPSDYFYSSSFNITKSFSVNS